MNTEPQEKILCAAVWYNDGVERKGQPENIDSGVVICGWRHGSCMLTLFSIFKRPEERIMRQGFLTSKNKFVLRNSAAAIAFKAGQVQEDNGCLLSEDLY